jgi:hypothetical protein
MWLVWVLGCDEEDAAGPAPAPEPPRERRWYRDEDGDGHGTRAEHVDQLLAPLGWSSVGDDCDDADPTRHPELCDGRPNDCGDRSWTDHTEDSLVTFSSAGTWQDVSALWGSGSPAQPAALALDEGQYSICPGTYYVSLVAPAPVRLSSPHALGRTVLDGAGERIVQSSAELSVEGLVLASVGAELLHAPADGAEVRLERVSWASGAGTALVDIGGPLVVLDSELKGSPAWGALLQVEGASRVEIARTTMADSSAAAMDITSEGPVVWTDVDLYDTGGATVAGEDIVLQRVRVIRSGGLSLDPVWDLEATELSVYGSSAGTPLSFRATDATLTDLVVEGNVCPRCFGWLVYGLTQTLVMDGARIAGNRTGSHVLDLRGAELSLRDVLVEDNVSSARSGGVHAVSGEISITSSTFRHNRGRWGGAMYIEPSASVTLGSGVLFEDNVATSEGGAVFVDGALRCEGSGASDEGFRRNEAPRGGAIYVEHGATFHSTCAFGEGADANTADEGPDLFVDDGYGHDAGADD